VIGSVEAVVFVVEVVGSRGAEAFAAAAEDPDPPGVKSANTGFSSRCARDRWSLRCSASGRASAAAVAYQPTTSNAGKTCLYRACCAASAGASKDSAPVASGACGTSKEVQISISRAPVRWPSRHPVTRGGAAPGGSCAATRVWWSETLMSTRGCSLYASMTRGVGAMSAPTTAHARGSRK
jgi:hypothetical protein